MPMLMMRAIITIIFVALNPGIAQSLNGKTLLGKSPVWSDPIYLNAINDIHAVDSSSAYMAGDRGLIMRSRDSGETWVKIRSPTSNMINNINTSESGQVCIQTNDSYSVSFDDSEHWLTYDLSKNQSVKHCALPRKSPNSAWIIIYRYSTYSQPGSVKLLRTTTAGKTWEPEQELNFVADVLRPIDGERAWAFEGNRVFWTADGGKYWREVLTLQLAKDESLRSSAALGERLVVATNHGRLFNIDVNQELQHLPSVPVEDRAFGIYFFSDGRAVTIDTSGRVLKSANYNLGIWSPPKSTSFGSINSASVWADGNILLKNTVGEVSVLKPDANNEDIVYDTYGKPSIVASAGNSHLILATSSGSILTTENGGRDWTQRQRVDHVAMLAASQSGHVSAVVDSNTIIISEDFGQTWKETINLPQGTNPKKLLISSAGHILAIASAGKAPLDQPKILVLRAGRASWVEASTNPRQIHTAAFVGDSEVVGVDSSGQLYHSENAGLDWTLQSSDIKTFLNDDEKEIELASDSTSIWFLDDKIGFVTGSTGTLFKTHDKGFNWQVVEVHPAGLTDIRAVRFFDTRNGFLYGHFDDGSGVREYLASTSDGGDTWTAHPYLGSASVLSLDMTPDGTGAYIDSEVIQYVVGVVSAPDFHAVLENSLTGVVYFSVRSSSRGRTSTDIKKLELLVRTDDKHLWKEQSLSSLKFSDDGTINFWWDPSTSGFSAGKDIQARLLVDLGSNVVSTVVFPVFSYLGWYSRNKPIVWIAVLALTAGCVAATSLLLLFITFPLYVTFLTNIQSSFVSAISLLPLPVVGVVKVFIFFGLVEWVAKSDRVVMAWVSGYTEGRVDFQDLNPVLREHYLQIPAVLDAWVLRRIEAVRLYFTHHAEFRFPENFVPLPATVQSDGYATRLATFDPPLLREITTPSRVVVAIVGEGGSGKTALAAQVAGWTMSNDPTKWLLQDAPSITVILSGDVQDIGEALRGELSAAYADSDPDAYSDDMLAAALQTRRLLVVFDGLTETRLATQEIYFSYIKRINAGVFVFTGRHIPVELTIFYVKLIPSSISVQDANWFVSQYIYLAGKTSKLEPSRQLALSDRVISLIRNRFSKSVLPPLLVKLFVDSYLDDGVEHDLEYGLGETVQRYIRMIGSKYPGETSQEKFVLLGEKMAMICLYPDFSPKKVYMDKVLSELRQSSSDIEGEVQVLVSANVLLKRVSAAGSTLSFRLDPVAEYLSASVTVRNCGSSVENWELHLQRFLDPRAVERARGYLVSLYEVCSEIGVTEPVVRKVAEKIKQIIKLK